VEFSVYYSSSHCIYTIYTIYTSAECHCVQDLANQEIVEILGNLGEGSRFLYHPKGAKRCKEVQNCAKSLTPEDPAGSGKLVTLRKCDSQVDRLSPNGYSRLLTLFTILHRSITIPPRTPPLPCKGSTAGFSMLDLGSMLQRVFVYIISLLPYSGFL